MALVAYSDESDLSDTEENTSGFDQRINIKIGYPKPKTTLPGGNIPSSIDSIVDEDDELLVQNKTIPTGLLNDSINLLSSLPDVHPLDTRKLHLDVDEKSDILDDVPTVETWKSAHQIENKTENKMEKTPSKNKNIKLKFILPALKELEDHDDEDYDLEKTLQKKRKQSSSGTGLFALLPNPKGITKPNQLVPKSVSKPKRINKPKQIPKHIIKMNKNDSDGEEDTFDSSDFFSLSSADSKISNQDSNKIFNLPIPNIAPTEAPALPPPKQLKTTAHLSKGRYSEPDLLSNDPYISQNVEDVTIANTSDVDIGPQPNNLINDEAIIRLAGRRNKGEIINLVDIKADDALVSREEWMTKSLTEEKPNHSFSRKKEGLPSHQQRRKHQITYLAHQAKERELELKNTWSQNRQTKMQTQAKYGF